MASSVKYIILRREVACVVYTLPNASKSAQERPNTRVPPTVLSTAYINANAFKHSCLHANFIRSTQSARATGQPDVSGL